MNGRGDSSRSYDDLGREYTGRDGPYVERPAGHMTELGVPVPTDQHGAHQGGDGATLEDVSNYVCPFCYCFPCQCDRM